MFKKTSLTIAVAVIIVAGAAMLLLTSQKAPEEASVIRKPLSNAANRFIFFPNFSYIYNTEKYNGNIWALVDGGLAKINTQNQQVMFVTPLDGFEGVSNNNMVRRENMLWTAMSDRLLSYNMDTGEIKQYKSDNPPVSNDHPFNEMHGLPSNSNLKLFLDPHENTLWATNFKGVSQYDAGNDIWISYDTFGDNYLYGGSNKIYFTQSEVIVFPPAGLWADGAAVYNKQTSERSWLKTGLLSEDQKKSIQASATATDADKAEKDGLVSQMKFYTGLPAKKEILFVQGDQILVKTSQDGGIPSATEANYRLFSFDFSKELPTSKYWHNIYQQQGAFIKDHHYELAVSEFKALACNQLNKSGDDIYLKLESEPSPMGPSVNVLVKYDPALDRLKILRDFGGYYHTPLLDPIACNDNGLVTYDRERGVQLTDVVTNESVQLDPENYKKGIDDFQVVIDHNVYFRAILHLLGIFNLDSGTYSYLSLEDSPVPPSSLVLHEVHQGTYYFSYTYDHMAVYIFDEKNDEWQRKLIGGGTTQVTDIKRLEHTLVAQAWEGDFEQYVYIADPEELNFERVTVNDDPLIIRGNMLKSKDRFFFNSPKGVWVLPDASNS